jgi:hypothetical protein
MYSGSNSFLGGQAGRPGGPQQYGQAPQQQQPQQNAFLNTQPTGYGAAPPLQQNFTGYPMQPQATGFQPQQLQSQQTAFPGQQQQINQAPQQQSFQTGAPPMPQMPLQYQNQGLPQQQLQQQLQQQQSPATLQRPQQTGFAQMADSFKAPDPAPARGRRTEKPKAGVKIPSVRLSFITATDQSKFEQLFRSAVGDGQTLSGDKSRDLLMRSKLDGNTLSQIWYVLPHCNAKEGGS